MAECSGIHREIHGKLVKMGNALMEKTDPRNLSQSSAQRHGILMGSGGRLIQPPGAQEGKVDRRSNGQKRLVRTDVRIRFFTPDMLFTRLKREHIRPSAFLVDRLPDEPPGNLAHERP